MMSFDRKHKKQNKSNISDKNSFKNPFTIVAFLLVLLFFVPLPEIYTPVKIVISILVITYGIRLGGFRNKNAPEEKDPGINKEELEEVEKNIENL